MNFLSIKILCPILLAPLFAIISCKDDEIAYPQGGFSYSKNISSRDSNNYFLPARHLLPNRDTFLTFDSRYFFEGFDEENLSLHPPKEDIFRFAFECSFCGKAAIIRLTKTEIIVKKNKGGFAGLSIEKDLLSPLEREHFHIFERYYPFTDSKYPQQYRKRYKVFFDSLIKKYPQLLDLTYFEQLRIKASIIHKMEDGYIIKKNPITVEKFRSFVALLNNSGFWQRSYRNDDCATAPTDGDGFIVEAATKSKYHFVNHDYCQGDDAKSSLRKMINELLGFIHFDLEAFYSEDFPKK